MGKRMMDRTLPDRQRDQVMVKQPSLFRSVTFSALGEYASSREERRVLYDGDYDEAVEVVEEEEFEAQTLAVRRECGNLKEHDARREIRLQEAERAAALEQERRVMKPQNVYAEYVRNGSCKVRGNESRLKRNFLRSPSLTRSNSLRRSRLSGIRSGSLSRFRSKILDKIPLLKEKDRGFEWSKSA